MKVHVILICNYMCFLSAMRTWIVLVLRMGQNARALEAGSLVMCGHCCMTGFKGRYEVLIWHMAQGAWKRGHLWCAGTAA